MELIKRLLALGVAAVLLCACTHGAAYNAKPRGAWSQDGSGTSSGFAWTLFVAGSDGGRCLAVDTNPPLRGHQGLLPEEEYLGKVPQCMPLPGTFDSKYLQAFQDTEALDGVKILTGLAAPTITQVNLLFKDHLETIDSRNGYFALVYPVKAELQKLDPVKNGRAVATCQFNGAEGPILHGC